jgi:putative addiction module component (TIGR02574 family)
MVKIKHSDILELTIPERLQLMQYIWESVREFADEIPLTKEQKDELDRRLEAHKLNSDEAIPWDEVREKLKAYK